MATDSGMEGIGQTADSLPPETESAARHFLAEAGYPACCALTPIKGGANNRVFRVDTPDATLLLKAYFQHPDDSRDRLGAEFSFAEFAWNSGARALPRPLARNDEYRLGLFEFISGRPPQTTDVTRESVVQALRFYRLVNENREHPGAALLPPASEACFTIAEHLQCVQSRIEKLGGIPIVSPIDNEASALIAGPLSKKWEAAKAAVRKQTGASRIHETVNLADRRLSPSDFGFHNALIGGDGLLRFFDFEYAGWDDPAKTVCDFFCQPAIPVPHEHYAMFAGGVAGDLIEPEMQLRRMALLMTVYQLKWVCILLNDFLLPGGARRNFALSAADREDRKSMQLEKARRALDSIEEWGGLNPNV